MNTKSLYAAIAVFSFALAVLGFVRFGIDWWQYSHGQPTGNSELVSQLNYRGLGGVLAATIICILFLLLHLRTKH